MENSLRSLEEEVLVSRHKSRQYLERAVEALGMVRHEMLELAQTLWPGLTIIPDQLKPLVDTFEKESGADD